MFTCPSGGHLESLNALMTIERNLRLLRPSAIPWSSLLRVE